MSATTLTLNTILNTVRMAKPGPEVEPDPSLSDRGRSYLLDHILLIHALSCFIHVSLPLIKQAVQFYRIHGKKSVNKNNFRISYVLFCRSC